MTTRSISGSKFNWLPSDIDFIKNNFHLAPSPKLAAQLGVSTTLFRTKAYELGLKKVEMEYWNPQMVSYLKRHYQKMGDVELAERFQKLYPKNKKWTKKHIEKKRRYLYLERTIEEQAAIKQRNTKQGRFPGRWENHQDLVTPIGTTKVYKFKSGRIAMVVKTKKGFQHYAPWLYRKEVGPIKKGHVIRLKDGNPLNVVVSNLEMITREQNQFLNAEMRKNYSPELKEIIKLTNKLKKTIKHHELNNIS